MKRGPISAGPSGEQQALAELVERALQRVDSAPVQCQVTGPLQVRDNSRIFRARCGLQPGWLAVKMCVDQRTGLPDGQSAAREFDTLEKVFSAMAEGRYRVPRPYAMDQEHGLLITEWIEGSCMTESFCTLRCTPARAQNLVRTAAEWLRQFHASHPGPSSTLDIDHKLGEIDALEGYSVRGSG